MCSRKVGAVLGQATSEAWLEWRDAQELGCLIQDQGFWRLTFSGPSASSADSFLLEISSSISLNFHLFWSGGVCYVTHVEDREQFSRVLSLFLPLVGKYLYLLSLVPGPLLLLTVRGDCSSFRSGGSKRFLAWQCAIQTARSKVQVPSPRHNYPVIGAFLSEEFLVSSVSPATC